MKKVLALFLAAILMIGLTACGGTIEKPAEQTETSSAPEGETTIVAGPTQITIGESMQYTSLDRLMSMRAMPKWPCMPLMIAWF
jgi:uncharacterized membrane protein